jgi:hypothetical protein
MKQVRIIKTYYVEDLQSDINRYTEQGWELYGNLVAIPFGADCIYLQTVIKDIC